jgi:hypothetical protein
MKLAVRGSLTFSLALQRLTEIAAGKSNQTQNSSKLDGVSEHSQAQDATFAMQTDEGNYDIVTSCSPPQPCIVFE